MKTLTLFALAATVLFGGNDSKSSSIIQIWLSKPVKIDACENKPMTVSLTDYTIEGYPLTFEERETLQVPATQAATDIKLAKNGKLTLTPKRQYIDDIRLSFVVRAFYETEKEILYEDAPVEVTLVSCNE